MIGIDDSDQGNQIIESRVLSDLWRLVNRPSLRKPKVTEGGRTAQTFTDLGELRSVLCDRHDCPSMWRSHASPEGSRVLEELRSRGSEHLLRISGHHIYRPRTIQQQMWRHKPLHYAPCVLPDVTVVGLIDRQQVGHLPNQRVSPKLEVRIEPLIVGLMPNCEQSSLFAPDCKRLPINTKSRLYCLPR